MTKKFKLMKKQIKRILKANPELIKVIYKYMNAETAHWFLNPCEHRLAKELVSSMVDNNKVFYVNDHKNAYSCFIAANNHLFDININYNESGTINYNNFIILRKYNTFGKDVEVEVFDIDLISKFFKEVTIFYNDNCDFIICAAPIRSLNKKYELV